MLPSWPGPSRKIDFYLNETCAWLNKGSIKDQLNAKTLNHLNQGFAQVQFLAFFARSTRARKVSGLHEFASRILPLLLVLTFTPTLVSRSIRASRSHEGGGMKRRQEELACEG